MVDVVMADMAMVTRRSPVAQRWRFWASFPGVHIAQFHFQVIGNCGVNSLMRRNNPDKDKGLIRAMAFQAYTAQGQYSLRGDVMLPEATVAIAGWRHAQYDGIVALAAVSL